MKDAAPVASSPQGALTGGVLGRQVWRKLGYRAPGPQCAARRAAAIRGHLRRAGHLDGCCPAVSLADSGSSHQGGAQAVVTEGTLRSEVRSRGLGSLARPGQPGPRILGQPSPRPNGSTETRGQRHRDACRSTRPGERPLSPRPSTARGVRRSTWGGGGERTLGTVSPRASGGLAGRPFLPVGRGPSLHVSPRARHVLSEDLSPTEERRPHPSTGCGTAATQTLR